MRLKFSHYVVVNDQTHYMNHGQPIFEITKSPLIIIRQLGGKFLYLWWDAQCGAEWQCVAVGGRQGGSCE